MYGMSKALLVAVVGVLVGVLASPGSVQAQATTVTGCLSKGSGDTFKLEGSDGKSYSLTSATVKLDEHVGHKVSVTGTAAPVETGAIKDTSMAHDTSMKGHEMKETTGASTLNVSELKHISPQCK
jgi:hypothetical protein